MKLLSVLKYFCLMLLLLATTASCNADPVVTPYTPKQIAQVIIATQDETSHLVALLPDEDYFYEYISDIYMLPNRYIAGGAIFYSAGMLADEVTVLKATEEADTAEMKKALEQYIERRITAFSGYAPVQAAVLAGGRVIVQGDYIALIICPDMLEAQSAFIACFSDKPPPLPKDNVIQQTTTEEATSDEPLNTPEGTATPEAVQTPEATPEATSDPAYNPADDKYDSDAVISAWKSGDTSNLTYKNRAIYDACRAVVDALITDGMSDYEIELALHDWIIDKASYDTEANSNAPDASPDPDNDNPYGLLINGKAICTGHALTFQLFMDLMEIECITVPGVAITGGDHAWNMVVIDGNWYCVDVTWNNPTDVRNISARYKYFNVPSRFLRDAGHKWDEENTPEATSPKLSPY